MYPGIFVEIIYNGKKELVTLYGKNFNGTPYVYVNNLKNMLRNIIAPSKRKLSLVSKMTRFTNIIFIEMNIEKIYYKYIVKQH